MNNKLSKEEISIIRSVRIHSILRVSDNGRRVSMPCPIHNGTNNNFNLYSDNSFHCFKCGANGFGAIDFCMQLGYSFEDSIKELIAYL